MDLLLASSTPETVNAVASTAETLGTPLVCSNIPWESWYLNLFPKGNPQKATEKAEVRRHVLPRRRAPGRGFIPMWNRIHAQLNTNKVVAAAFPNDSDGNAFRAVFPRDRQVGRATRCPVSSPYTDGTTNYSSMISQFKNSGADFFTNVPLPPDFATMWKQAVQQGFKPKLATVAKVLLFPTDAYALGDLVNNIATDAWWAPSLPWTSSFTGETCQQLADAVRGRGHGQWNSNISNYTLFEIAHAALTVGEQPARQERGGRRHPPGERQRRRRADRLHLEPRRPRPAWPSPRRSASSGRRAPSTRSRPRWSTTRCSRRRRSPATCSRPTSDPMTSPLLQLDQVTKRFGQVVIAEELSLSVGAGDTVGIVGPNGAGKTSLFGLISGDLAPDAGQLSFAGRTVTKLDPAARCRLGIGRTYQVPRPFTDMTVFENLLVAAQQGGGLRRRASYAAAAEALDRTGMAGQANLPAARLGLLQRKRLELARALASRPQLLLLDEVAGGLTDPEVAQLVEIVRAVNAEGIAVIWIEHVVRALTAVVSRLLCLYRRRVHRRRHARRGAGHPGGPRGLPRLGRHRLADRGHAGRGPHRRGHPDERPGTR